MDDRERDLSASTYAAAGAWAAFLLAMAWVVPACAASCAKLVPDTYPLVTRIVLNVPASGWVVPGVLVPAALVAKSRLLPARSADAVDTVALCACAASIVAVGVALLGVLGAYVSFPPPEYVIPAPRG